MLAQLKKEGKVCASYKGHVFTLADTFKNDKENDVLFFFLTEYLFILVAVSLL